MFKQLPILGFCASASNCGKTTLLEKLIPELKRRGIRISVIKHAHHKFDVDHPGKDSYKIREAGAVQTLVASGSRWALMTEMQRTPQPPAEAQLEQLITLLDANYADMILVEGFKNADIPKIEVCRPELGIPLLCQHDPSIIAVATDGPLGFTPDIAVLDLNNPQQIANFILQTIYPS